MFRVARIMIAFALKTAVRLGTLLICAAAAADELHPIVAVSGGSDIPTGGVGLKRFRFLNAE
jgi:hypothetical protein